MVKKYHSLQTIYFKNRNVIFAALIGFSGLGLIYFGCNRSATSLYEVVLKTPPPKSVKFYNSQDCYILDCCLWLHFTIDSIDLNRLLRKGFKQEKLYLGFASVPPEAEAWWHPETLGDNTLFYTREIENARQALYTNPSKNEVYLVHYFK